MRIVKVEVEVHMPDEMRDAAVEDGIDHMLDAGEAIMVDAVHHCAEHPEIDEAIAGDCVELTVHDSEVVSSLENQPEHPEPPLKMTYLPRLDDDFAPFGGSFPIEHA